MGTAFADVQTVREGMVNGRLFAGVGEEPHPGVLLLHGGGGARGYEQRYAAMLAEHGYTVFCVEYFGAPGIRDALLEIPLAEFGAAAEWLLDRPAVDGESVGVVGFSRGGEGALVVGSEFDTVGMVAAYVPGCYRWAAPSWMDGVGEDQPTWTRDGEAPPYVCVDEYVTDPDGIEQPLGGGGPCACTLALDRASEETLSAAAIPVEEIDGPVLLVSGGEDAVWPSARMAAAARARLDEAAHPWRYEHLSFPDAGHTIRVPYRFDGDTDPDEQHRYGGTERANAAASARAWERTLSYLDHAL